MQTRSTRFRVALVPALFAAVLIAAPVAAAGQTTTAPRTAVISGTGTLTARGAGIARLRGGYVLSGAMDGGTLRIVGSSRFAAIRVTSWASRTRLADGTLLYRGVHGLFRIAGRSLVTTIESTHMRFTATGHGRATLRGRGQYWVNGHGPTPWSAAGTTRSF